MADSPGRINAGPHPPLGRVAPLLSRTEGIIPALEPAHALAWLVRAVREGQVPKGSTVLMTLSGRGDKDAEEVMKEMTARGMLG